jgi:signal transduction histidine kinase
MKTGPELLDFQPDVRPVRPVRALLRFVWTTIAPRYKDQDIRNREIVLNVLLVTTLFVLSTSLVLLLISYAGLGHYYVWPRVVENTLALALMIVSYTMARSRHYWIAACILILAYFAAAIDMLVAWGVTVPIGLLVLALTVVLTGILLGARYSLYAVASSIVILIGLQQLQAAGVIHPDMHWLSMTTSLGGVLGFCLVFIVLAVSSWLFNRQTEKSLQKAMRAEVALTRQKALLEVKVEERTRELQEVQLEKVQQVYRFAELGQLSAALLHDVANQLTTLSVDIEDLRESDAPIIHRAKQSIQYMDDMVRHAQAQLDGKKHDELFGIADVVNQVVGLLKHKAQQSRVTLEWQPSTSDKKLRCRGDSIRFRQLLTNITSNAIDAYDETDIGRADRIVELKIERDGKNAVITVTDWGKGIPAAQRDKIFQPFYGTKKTGMGIGLFLARQIAEEYFDGSITVESSDQGATMFRVTIAKVRS